MVIDPIVRLELRTGRDDLAPAVLVGDVISIRPELLTGDGLRINSVTRGQGADGGHYASCSAAVELRSADGTLLDSFPSGFA